MVIVFVRGFGSGKEGKRNDVSFYRGIVVRNDDPLQMNRVKVFIPELSNQPFENWFDEFENIVLKSPGKNLEKDNWKDIDIYQEILKNIPWAEIVYPVIGESSNSRYFVDSEMSTITDANYSDRNENTPVSLKDGSFSPAYLYDNIDTMVNDFMSSPIPKLSVKNNPYSFSYQPNKMVGKTKGLMGIPEIGAKVWVQHYMGDLNFPIVFGVMQDHKSLKLINENVNYPRNTENKFINE
jgi:hypothetical protein